MMFPEQFCNYSNKAHKVHKAHKQQEEHNWLTVTMYSGMFIDEGRRGRVGMHAIVMGYNAHHYLWPLLQKAASLASEVPRDIDGGSKPCMHDGGG